MKHLQTERIYSAALHQHDVVPTFTSFSRKPKTAERNKRRLTGTSSPGDVVGHHDFFWLRFLAFHLHRKRNEGVNRKYKEYERNNIENKSASLIISAAA